MAKTITVDTLVHSPMELVWDSWTSPKDIQMWNHASDDWECPHAENDLQVGGQFLARMSAKDGSFSFDFTGTYTTVELHKKISYTITGGREVTITFTQEPNGIRVEESFELENENPEEMQRNGWQAILNNFKAHTESLTALS